MAEAAAVERLPIRALVVDDDPVIVTLLCAFLQARGFRVDQAGDGQEALARLAGGGFNLVITDRHMPRTDGLALCRAIRAIPSAAYVYCIMLTSSSDGDTLVAAMEAGADDFLPKPLNPAELGARLHAAERVLALEAGLATRNQALARAYDQLSRELELARTMQHGLLPVPAQLGAVHYDWLFEPASFVAGDTLDYFALDARYQCFYVVDVSGHGVSAAMMALNAQHQLLASAQQTGLTLLRAGAALGTAAAAVVAEFNRRFLQMKDTSLYLTMLFGVIDSQAGVAALVQAGHPPPLHSAAPGAPFLPVGDGGLPVGVLADADYEAHTVPMGPGARLAVYSDGVTDCAGAAGEPFGPHRLRQALERERSAPLARTGLAVRADLLQWRGSASFDDDVTFLVLEVC